MKGLRGVLRPLVIAGLAALAACAPKPTLEGADRDALAALAAQVDQAALMDFVTQAVTAHRSDAKIDCSALNATRGPLCNLSNQKAGEMLEARLQALGLRVVRQENAAERFPTSNVVAELPGVSRPEEVVLIGAHHDAFWDGADDNTSGVATVLEVARVLSRYRFDRTIRFVGFDLEELGLVGSGRFVQARASSERITAALVLDCVGYYDTRPGSQRSLPGFPSPESGDFVAVIGDDLSSQRAAEVYALNDLLRLTKVLTVLSPRDGTYPLGGDLLRSDHTSFWLAGQPALFFTDTAFLRNPNYHQPSDTVETLEPTLFRGTVQLSAAAVAYWAGGPR